MLRARAVSAEERAAVRRLAHARTAPARRVERARIVWLSLSGERVPAIASAVGCSEQTVRNWLHRFNTDGVAGLEDGSRSGRPSTYTEAEVGIVLAAALQAPQALGQPFGCWTLDRLATYVQETHGISMKRSRISEVLVAEGLRWRSQEAWFGERVDPEFAQKGGRS